MGYLMPKRSSCGNIQHIAEGNEGVHTFSMGISSSSSGPVGIGNVEVFNTLQRSGTGVLPSDAVKCYTQGTFDGRESVEK